ncbi:ferric-dicitrate binding protein FerR (iron transport regulator) [Pedobacter sp. AK017]|uniref:FecR family protein n=1 Tax=Pedobacter sp. AK017 TaxID=2723073 RepID=UPI0016155306|nr:FecR family protein [Pedobacter sp. AK017]MBB5437690.1 ferric-dicitrate binding protein FerR (iron transport regulator) [Pedobacter sp. AK017]
MNKQERISFLLDRYIHNNCTAGELDELFQLLDHHSNNDFLQRELKLLWQHTGPEQHHTNAQWEQLYNSMMHKTQRKPKVKSKWPYQKLAAAASVILLLFAGIFFYSQYQNTQHKTINKQIHAKNELVPGTNKAILTLANGTRVPLDDVLNGKVSTQAGVQLTKTASGQLIYHIQQQAATSKLSFNAIETPRGGQYQLILSDGTRVWLNANSSLKYPISFSKTERLIELKGEAYFEVTKNKNAPFKVISNNQVLEVLGTHFNINGYEDEPDIKTTLIEGSVKVSNLSNHTQALLKPGQQSSFHTNRFEISKVDTEAAIAWKNGYFTFDKTTLETIMRQVSRWYDVEVTYQNKTVKDQVFSGNVSRFENAAQVLAILELTGLVHFKVEGRRITAML